MTFNIVSNSLATLDVPKEPHVGTVFSSNKGETSPNSSCRCIDMMPGGTLKNTAWSGKMLAEVKLGIGRYFRFAKPRYS